LVALHGVGYAELTARLLQPFLGDAMTAAECRALTAESYARFEHPAVAPLVQIDRRLWLLELFHGPTLAFKDYALQLLGRLFDHLLRRRGERITVIGATSGDTGSAAIEACRDRDAIDIFILHPKGRVSEVQRRQMTTVDAGNVHNIAVEGSFDDCQALVKAMFNDAPFRDRMRLAAVNSINVGRILGQIAYYLAAAMALGAPGRRLAFSVPTGNFGNVFAAYAARAMGVPIERLIVGTNENDILDRFFRTGEMRTERVVPTISPAMDIQVSSNFERLLFDLLGRDGAGVGRVMQAFREDGRFAVDAGAQARAQAVFASRRVDEAATLAEIARTRAETGRLVDPHTAVGLAAARAAEADLEPETALVALACAHPAKFPEPVEQATGERPRLPERLADLLDRPERVAVLDNDLAGVQAFIADRARLTGVAA
jgi:threonine synthase